MIYAPRYGTLVSSRRTPAVPIEINRNNPLTNALAACYVPGSPSRLVDINQLGPRLLVNGAPSGSYFVSTQVGIGGRADNGSPSGALSSSAALNRIENTDMTLGWFGFNTGNGNKSQNPIWGISKAAGSKDLVSIAVESGTGHRILWLYGNGASSVAHATTFTVSALTLNAVALSFPASGGTALSSVNGADAGGSHSTTFAPVFDGTERVCLGCNAYDVTIVPNTRDLMGVIWLRALSQDELNEWTRNPFGIIRPQRHRTKKSFATGAFSASVAESVTGSELYSTAFAATDALTDSAVSSDIVAPSFLLEDSSAALDAYIITVPLSDSASSSDLFSIPVALASDSIASSDDFIVLTAFPFSLADSAIASDRYVSFVQTGAFEYSFECGPISIFPTLPVGFPLKLSLVMDTTVGTTKSLREMRVAQQTYPLWDIELVFEELLDQTQNSTPYSPFAGQTEYEQLVQQWLMSYGQTGVFAFEAPWDNSRTDQAIGVGDGVSTDFTVFRTWATGAIATSAPVGVINTVTNVKLNGSTVSSSAYYTTRSVLTFFTAPPAGAVITMTFSFYYLCRFVADEQDFEEFAKNRWTVPSLKFRAVYWPGCQ